MDQHVLAQQFLDLAILDCMTFITIALHSILALAQWVLGLIMPHCLKVTCTALQFVQALRERVGTMVTVYSM